MGKESNRLQPVGEANTLPSYSYTFVLTVVKEDLDDKLGMDVKHIDGRLEVVDLLPEGAVARASASLGPDHPDRLRVGDVIISVNGVDKSDMLMVNECMLSSELKFEVARF